MLPLITEPALDDLAGIWDDLSGFDLGYAERTVKTLVDQILLLGEFPEAHPVVRNVAELPIRRLNVGVWAVFYTVDKGRPTVIRIISGRRDLGRLLAELNPPTT